MLIIFAQNLMYISMNYSFEEKKGVQILRVDSLLNPTDNLKLIEIIEDKIRQRQARFIVDLVQMDYMNSNGLTFLISILTRSRNAGGDVAIANLSDNIKKVLLITRLQSAFSLHNSVDTALDFFMEQV
jgi:anti-sigma B factor antagonist